MTTYDRLTANPPPGVDETEVGTEDGETCGRFSEPDEDAPRGYRAKPCPGEMTAEGGFIACDTCGEAV